MTYRPLPGRRPCAFRASVLAVFLCTTNAVTPTFADASEGAPRAALAHEIDRSVAAAAHRFGLPEAWIRAVIAAESAGDPRAVSSAGAMGLMQLMPGTWAALRARLRLGPDPFDPRDNILAGTAYLRVLHDRFGAPGFLAAYNAGPARYEDHLATGDPLPRETRDYLARLAPIVGKSATAAMPRDRRRNAADWRAAPVFVARRNASTATAGTAGQVPEMMPTEGLFVPLRDRRAR